jgi:energy-coupling factor transport system ATP-binding protein
VRVVQPFIEIRSLAYAYSLDRDSEVKALDGIDLTVGRGEFVAIIGPNGSGKSTLARHLNGLLVPAAGEVLVDGLSTADPDQRWAIRERVSMVFQNPDNQFVASTVEEDVAFGPENLGLPISEVRRRVDDALQVVGLAEYSTHPPHMLSGGQKQRVAIAGALATRSSCLVLDEPTSMLDPYAQRQILDTILHLNGVAGITIVLITQSMAEAAAAGRIIVMSEGRIVLDGCPSWTFEHAEQLFDLGLAVPPAVEMARILREHGVAVPPGVLAVDELAIALC